MKEGVLNINSKLSRVHREYSSNPALNNSFSKKLLFLILSALCFTGNYYAYDLPAALNLQIKDILKSENQEWQVQLALFYSLYSLPNVVLPFFMARYVDKLGSKNSLIIFCFMVMVGQYLFSYGLEKHHFNLMLFGRLMVGLGGESIGIAQARLTCHWFEQDELGLALTINLGIARLGSVLSDILSPYIALNYSDNMENNTIQAFWFGWYMCCLSFLCSLLLVFMDLFYISWKKKNLYEEGSFIPQMNENGQNSKRNSTLINNYSTFNHKIDPLTSINQPIEEIPSLSLSALTSFTFDYWCLSCLILCGYAAVIPFINISSYFIQAKWYPNQPQLAGFLLATPDLLCTLLVPILSFLIKGIRARLLICFICGLGLASCHLLLSLVDLTSPIPPMILLGLFYSLITSSVWSSIPFFVPDHYLPLAYATSTSILNLGLSISPLVVSQIIIIEDKFISLERFFSMLGLIACFISLYLLAHIYFCEIPLVPSRLEEEIAEDFESIEEEFDIEDQEQGYGSNYTKGTASNLSAKSFDTVEDRFGINIHKGYYQHFNVSRETNVLNQLVTPTSNASFNLQSNDSAYLAPSAQSSELSISPLFYSLPMTTSNPKSNQGRQVATVHPPVLPSRFSNLVVGSKEKKAKRKKSRKTILTQFNEDVRSVDLQSEDNELGLGPSKFVL
ncbi:MFS general substrate transporter [Neoconidiobolus thromboides FSU 785]|nr:MFS general substrate transporter [Neoconidiobolus thromboides FSU 785]